MWGICLECRRNDNIIISILVWDRHQSMLDWIQWIMVIKLKFINLLQRGWNKHLRVIELYIEHSECLSKPAFPAANKTASKLVKQWFHTAQLKQTNSSRCLVFKGHKTKWISRVQFPICKQIKVILTKYTTFGDIDWKWVL